MTSDEREQMVRHKKLYHKMQNIEDHPDVIDESHSRLVQLLDVTVAEARRRPAGTILELPPTFCKDALRGLLASQHRSTCHRYEAYCQRRAQGGSRELFPNREFAVQWLRLASCVKYVDGSWVGNGLSCATHRGDRFGAKNAWQVMSEEFGDGDLQKHHVWVYEALMRSLEAEGASSMPGYEWGFDGFAEGEGAPRCWTAAVAQQLIGLHAAEFLPEALGFNMAYEALPYHLLVTTRELKELKIDNYYFALHVTIDNADSGHAAVARVAVENYLAGVRERQGEQAESAAWRRVQAGFILAEGLPTTPSGPIEHRLTHDRNGLTTWVPVPAPAMPPSKVECQMVELFSRKAAAAEKMHCPSKVLIGGHTIEDWLLPTLFTAERGLAFLRALADTKPWVIKGKDASQSKLVRELEWGGKMFGAFSRKEVDLVREWVDELGGKSNDGAYAEWTGRALCARTVTEWDLITPRQNGMEPEELAGMLQIETRGDASIKEILGDNPEIPDSLSEISHLLPLWYLSTALLEMFPLQTSKFATPLGACVLRVLRSQLGFDASHNEKDICAGMDDVEQRENGLKGLWEIGNSVFERQGLFIPDNLTACFTRDDKTDRLVVEALLKYRSQPYRYRGTLLGLTLGFTRSLAHQLELISDSEDDQVALRRISEEVADAISDYTDGVAGECHDFLEDVRVGYALAQAALR